MDPTLRARLQRIVGPTHVIHDPETRASYETDWTRRFSGTAAFVVRPADTSQVARVLQCCREAGVPLVPQGGNTGLVGGSVPRSGEGVLSLRRLDTIEDFDPVAGEVTVGAGVTLERLQQHVRPAGWDVGVDLASRASATIGGMVATNAGGVRVIRYGPMRHQLIGLEAVLADGAILSRLPGLLKDNTGYDLPGLLAGSEGTLAVITRVRLRLIPNRPARAVALIGLPSVAAALEIVRAVRAAAPTLEAAEVFFPEGLALVLRHTGLRAPFARPYPCYLLLECAGATDPAPALAALLEPLVDPAAALLATDRPDRDRLWAYRERHTEAISAEGIPHKLDVTLPIGRLAQFEREVRSHLAALAPSARPILFGHAGDGNLHVNLLGLPPDDETADDAVLRLVASLGGSISAEHGIGIAKKPWLHLTRSPADLHAMQAIKRALDPAGILNPGVIFDLDHTAPAPDHLP
ncbi:FAD-binding oxidoreductase [Tepidiforma sp.]|uniref:FAD-binding oxidoreductase n=1 Tax=Tepidiforma sp. TaxID=2682230 RepID=UPI002ADE4CB5|nr:FAD-binding oxidoreductase [Tepidiforma sp.]